MPRGKILYILTDEDKFIAVNEQDTSKIKIKQLMTKLKRLKINLKQLEQIEKSRNISFIVDDNFYDCHANNCCLEKTKYNYCHIHACRMEGCYMKKFGSQKYCMFHLNKKSWISKPMRTWKKINIVDKKTNI
jgi:hypothetical protein